MVIVYALFTCLDHFGVFNTNIEMQKVAWCINLPGEKTGALR